MIQIELFGFDWGYCSFALPVEVICEVLGAANTSAKQLTLAFELGRRRILPAVEKRAILGHIEPILLVAADLLAERHPRLEHLGVTGFGRSASLRC